MKNNYNENKWLLCLKNISLEYSFDLQMFAAEDEGRTEQPTEYKKRKAREEGQVPKSQELTAIIVFLICFWTGAILSRYIFERLLYIVRYYTENLLYISVTKNSVMPFFINMTWLAANCIFPFMLVGVVSALAANLMQGGFVFSTKRISLDFSKIINNMGKNFMKMFFSGETLFNLLKSVMKFVGVFVIMFLVLNSHIQEYKGMFYMGPLQSFAMIWTIIFQFVSFAGVLLLIFAIGDYAFQRHIYIEQLKMKKEEVKQEIKEQEGDPEMKGRIRELGRKMLRRNLAKEVPQADVVITNPTHFAVALKYDMASMTAPTVIAKGQDLMAQRIKDIARESGVYIIENKPLARELYRLVEVGDEIPQHLFEAVAKVLSFVYRLKETVVV